VADYFEGYSIIVLLTPVLVHLICFGFIIKY